jgi:iron(III) transport system ATP-binding protein
VLLDEPFSNLDAGLRDRLRQDVREILDRAGVTALFVTHDQAEALSIADVVAVMHEGRVDQVGPPEEVYAQPTSRRVAAFLGEVEVLSGRARGGRVECELGELPAPAGLDGAVDVLIRPEAVAIGAPDNGGVSAEIVRRRFFGHDQLIDLRLPSGHVLRSRRLGVKEWEPGSRVSVWVDGPADVLPAGGD